MAAAVITAAAVTMVEGVTVVAAADFMVDIIAAAIGVAVATMAAEDAGIGGTGFGTHTVGSPANSILTRGRLLAVPFLCGANHWPRRGSPSTAAAATGSGITHLGWRERLGTQLGGGRSNGGIAIRPVVAAACEAALPVRPAAELESRLSPRRKAIQIIVPEARWGPASRSQIRRPGL
jgi:uncharacterized protein with LGFP repeats